MRILALLLLLVLARDASALDVSNRYRSPRNPERKVRASTELIVLHTTEAPAKSSLNKLSERGEAHYCVTEEGFVYRIVDRDREAFHAGRSMWNGKEDVDKFSIGIECVGYHDKAMGIVQVRAIRDLVKELQKMYKIPDDHVVCHSHVAYGAPNKWQKSKHRGRKRCGMLFAMPTMRAQLGLKSRPTVDKDVRAKRLVVGDDYLKDVLYGNIDTMKGKYTVVASTETKPSGGGLFSWLKLGRSSDPEPAKTAISAKPAPAKPTVAAKPAPAKPTTAATKPKAAAAKTTPAKTTPAAKPASATKPAVAAKPAAAPAKAQPQSPPKSIDELKSRGYVLKGSVTIGMTASKIAGGKWNSSDTYYTIRNKVIPGTSIDPARIENGMGVWMKGN